MTDQSALEAAKAIVENRNSTITVARKNAMTVARALLAANAELEVAVAAEGGQRREHLFWKHRAEKAEAQRETLEKALIGAVTIAFGEGQAEAEWMKLVQHRPDYPTWMPKL